MTNLKKYHTDTQSILFYSLQKSK